MRGVNRSGDISPWEVPEIDGVRQSLEFRIWDDQTSDDWLRLIDQATDPHPLTEERQAIIGRLMRRFAEKDDYMRSVLLNGAAFFDTPDLIRHYESALDQVAELADIDTSELTTV